MHTSHTPDDVLGPSGLTRIIAGLAMGLVLGIVSGLFTPRRDGPRRSRDA